MGFLRPGSLRFKALVAVIMVVLSPAVFVWSTSLVDTGSIAILRTDLTAATTSAVRGAREGTLDLEGIATARRVRIRVLDADGTTVLHDTDHDGDPRWYHPITEPWFGPEGRPDPAVWDAGAGPLAGRPEILDAAASGTASFCGVGGRSDLLVCAEVRRVETPEGTRTLHIQRSVAQSTRALWEDRFQMTQLTLIVLVFAVLLTLWLGTRWVRPIESLRDQALARTQHGVSTQPLTIERRDELGEVADAFNTLLAAIEQRNQANEAFAADLAHELKNPIAAVRTAAEALESGKPLTEARAERLHRILTDSSKRMQLVIDRFLELARAEAGLVQKHVEPVDLVGLVNGLLHGLRVDERFGGMAFELVVDGDPRPLDGDEERLETAFRNLLINAATFASPDGRVSVTVRAWGRALDVAVQDSGPGIAPDDLPRVFDRYFSKRQGGTGLGLALSKAIVEAHGGELLVESPPGSGALFTARFHR
ncbi:MAG: HAMP domain-containing sensor histidine kinase [Myxococcota bacterium]